MIMSRWLLAGLLPHHTGEGFVIALCAAGAPFVLQLGAMARIPYGETAGPMGVLLLGSIAFMPLVVPFLLTAAAIGVLYKARASISGAEEIRPRLSRTHCTRDPVTAMEPSRA